MDLANSDFAAVYFSTADVKHFQALLVRLRTFEKNVADEFRQLNAKIDALDQASKINKTGITVAKGSITKLRNSLNKMGDWVKTQFENMNHSVEEFDEDEANLDENNVIVSTADGNDGNADGNDRNESEDGNDMTNEINVDAIEDEADVFVSDPFLGNTSFVGNFDGNPATSFIAWFERFSDLLSLATVALTEPQKLARLRFCLSGQARAAFDSINPAPTTLQEACDNLKARFNNGQTKIFARQALSICRQAPNESVFTFANRLTETVKSALTGESDAAIDRRLFDEFLERLQPALQYEVKSQRPVDYTGAYELALHFELLMGSKKGDSENLVNKLVEKVEALTVQKGNAGAVVCYACRQEGHMARNCPVVPASSKGNHNYGNRHKNNQNRQNNNRNRYNNRRGSQGNGGYQNRSQERNYHRNENYGNYDGNYNRDGNYNNYNQGSSRNYERYNNDYQYRDSRRSRDYSGDSRRGNERYENRRTSRDRHHSPHVRFERGGSPGIRVASPVREQRSPQPERGRRSPRPYFRCGSPLFLMIVALIACFLSGAAASPMICLKDAPTSLWRLPSDPICPDWKASESPFAVDLQIYRPNTLQYKTEATICRCINTKVSRRLGIFGSPIQETEVENLNVPISACKSMKELNTSIAGEMKIRNGSLKSTDNDLDIGWKPWPIGIAWTTKEIKNCYLFESIVFTHFGTSGISTPIGACPECRYSAGSCKCSHGSLIWTPDKTQQCAFVHLAIWRGEYASNIWIAESNDFALSFANGTRKIDCNETDLMISDQGFAVPIGDYRKLQHKTHNSEEAIDKRWKRETEPAVGLVYSTQVAAQFTALSAQLALTAQKLFSESVRQICSSLQTVADQIQSLAAANPTLLARLLLNTPHISARLVTSRTLEIKPCHEILEDALHFNWRHGFCFDRLPISFVLHGHLKHGFLDTSTAIIHHEANHVNCDIFRFLYVRYSDRTVQFDQLTGDQKEVPEEAIRKIIRYGKIEFPEIAFTIFKNKILANLTEIYSPEHFDETLETAAISHEIARLSNPSKVWTTSSSRGDLIAGNIVSSGLFAFLKGGLFTINQFWVFCCCCFVTVQFLLQFILPALFARNLELLNLGERIFQFAMETRRKRRANRRGIEAENNLARNGRPALPLTQRWASHGSLSNRQQQKERSVNYKKGAEGGLAEIIVAETAKCDENMRILAEINGHKVKCLLDTGAYISLMSLSTAKKLGLRSLKQPSFAAVFGIGDNTVATIGQAEVELKLADCAAKTTIMVINHQINKYGSYEIIIGRQSLKALPLLLNFSTWELVNSLNGTVLNLDRKMESGENSLLLDIAEKSGLDKREEKGLFLECLKRNGDAFARHEYDISACKITAPPIHTNSNVPIQAKPFRTPEKYKDELKLHIGKMLKAGIIKESNTPWTSNFVLVQKANGSLRPCVDFRPLNQVTIPDAYPLPRLEELIHSVAGKAFYSTLDLASGFWQIKLDEESSFKCGIITEWGLYQMLRLPFGLRNAPAVFQRTMDVVLKGETNARAYIDDILIFSDTFEGHLKDIERVLGRLKEYGLKLKGEKCRFFEKECTYLGHQISENGYQPAKANCEAIKQFPAPKNIKEVKRFLGMTSFFRKFIDNFSTLAYPLNKLTRGKEPIFEWKEAHESAFRKLKEKLIALPCLRPPVFDLPFHLFCDASNLAYGASLMQSSNGQDLHAVGFWSRTLSDVEARLPPTHGELASIYNAIQFFRPIIYGCKLIIYTDHKPLTFLFNKASSNAKINRWLMFMQEIEPSVVYLAGHANKVADALSRVPIPWGDVTKAQIKLETPYIMAADGAESINLEMIENETAANPLLLEVMEKIKINWSGEISELQKPFYQIRDKLYMEGKIIKKRPSGQIVVPENLKISILLLLHRAHFGIARSKAKARQIVWWPGMNTDIENFVGACAICQKNGPDEPQISSENRWPEAKTPFERVHIDLAGPLFNTDFLIVIDAYSRFPWAFPLRSTTSNAIIILLRDLFSTFGPPNLLVSDNGPQLVSQEFEAFLYDEGIRHIKSPPYHPPSNGLCERFVRTFKTGVIKIHENVKDLKIASAILLREYRACPSMVLNGNSPAEKFLGRSIKSSVDLIALRPAQSSKDQPDQELPEERIQSSASLRKTFDEGDLVWVRDHSGKSKWAAAKIVSAAGDHIYKVRLEESGAEKLSHKEQLKARKVFNLRSRHQSLEEEA